jgi:hypothetical protein
MQSLPYGVHAISERADHLQTVNPVPNRRIEIMSKLELMLKAAQKNGSLTLTDTPYQVEKK